jgi:apolipoprotein N-acyltransferase
MVVKHIEFFRIARRYEKRVPFIIALVAVLIAFAFPKAEILILIIFAIVILIFSIYRFDPRILIAYAILLLVITGVLQFWNSEFSSQIAVLSYWVMSAGVIYLIVDLYRRTKSVGLVT